MVLETFDPGPKPAINERLEFKGRLSPEGLEYGDCWVETDGPRCFQLTRTAQPSLFAAWTRHWDDLADFEIVPLADDPRR